MERESSDTKSAPLTWGQEVIWAEHESLPALARGRFNIPIEVPLASGVPLDAVRNAIATLVRRHETLRTVFMRADGGRPLQVIEPYSDQLVHVQDHEETEETEETGSDSGRAPYAEALLHEPFDLCVCSPWRAGVIRENGGDRTLILVVHHILADAGGIPLLRGELRQELAGRPAEIAGPARAVAQPYDLTLFETSATGRLINERSLDHLREVLSQAPPRMFRAPDGQRSCHQFEMESPQTFAAADRVASQCDTSLATIYLAVFASFIAGVSGLPVCAFTMDVANRYDKLTKQVVGSVFAPVPVLIDLTDDPPFLEVVRRAEDASVAAQGAGRFSFLELKRLERDIACRRGVRFRWGINFNFIPARPELAEVQPSPPAELPQAEACRWLPDSAETDIDFWWAVDADASRLEVVGNSEILPPDLIARMAAGIRPILLAAAAGEGEGPRTSEIARYAGLSPQLPDHDWYIGERGWVSLSELAMVLSAHPSVDGCDLYTHRAAPHGPIQIAAAVSVKDDSADARALRTYLLERLGRMRSCAIPGRLDIRPA